jgi:hypothetical protein
MTGPIHHDRVDSTSRMPVALGLAALRADNGRMHARELLWGLVSLVPALLVCCDAHRIGLKGAYSHLGVVGWTVLTVLVPFAALFYVWRRREYVRAEPSQHAEEQVRS